MWFPVDDAFHSHPKAQRAGDEALGMWVRAGSHCMAYLTDGFVAEWWVKQQPKGLAKASKLVQAELWRRGENDGEPGWWFHDWKPENLKVNILAAREQARQRKAKSRSRSRVTDTVTAHVTDASVPPTTPPHPTPHHTNTVVQLVGDLSLVDASDDPPPHCSKHPTGTSAPCRGCEAARHAAEGIDRERAEHARAQREAEQQDALEAKLAAITVCEICDSDGYDGTRVCDHVDRSSIARAGAARARAALENPSAAAG